MTARVLVRAPNWLGDAVMCGPFLRRLIDRGDPVDVAAPPAVIGVFQGFPGLADVLPWNPSEPLLRRIRRLKERGYRRAYALPPSFSSALHLRLAGIPERLGGATDFRRPLLTRAVPWDERFHYVRRYLSLLDRTGDEVGPGDFYFPTAPAEEARAVLSAAGATPGKILAVAPGSRAEARRWPAERFAAAIDALGPDWTAVVLLGAAEDRPAADRVATLARRPVVNLCGATPLPRAAALLKECRALLTNESGLMHVAWAVGTPLVVVAGPSEPRATSPFGVRARVLQRRDIPCVPCVRNDCGRAGDEKKLCLSGIAPVDAARAVEETGAG